MQILSEKLRKVYLTGGVHCPKFVTVGEKQRPVNKRIRYILPLLMFLSLATMRAQETLTVWPGDANNNGIVNGVDVLYWSVARGERGPGRSREDSLWSEQNVEAWDVSFPDGLNYAFADCDGNGIINAADLQVIRRNFLRTRENNVPDLFTEGFEGIDPPLILSSDNGFVLEGETAEVDVFLGDENIPAEGFFGITFTIPYDPELKKKDQPAMFELERESWLGRENAEVRQFTYTDEEGGKTHIAVYRVRKENAPPDAGRIGVYSIIVVEDIALGVNSVDLGLEDVKMVSLDLTERPVALDTLSLVVERSTTNRGQVINDDSRLQVFPNPVRDEAMIRWTGEGYPIEQVDVLNALGQPLRIIRTGNYTEREIEIDMGSLPPGFYILRVHTREGLITRTINKHR